VGNEITVTVNSASVKDLPGSGKTVDFSEVVPKAGSFFGSRPLVQWMKTPWVDRSLAVIAVLPFVYPIAVHFSQYARPGEILYLVETLILTCTMLFRRPAVRITTNPMYWLVAFLATYWGFLILSVQQQGRPLVNWRLTLPIYFASAFVAIWGRLSLGRNIGMVPAQREVVDGGAYRWMRHPIYTAFFLSLIGGLLGSYSSWNLVLYSVGAFWFVIRSQVEEEFLREDPKYSAYTQRVPWRWFPGII
jgi:protein-S-isoprenylcysteine O-methyltransferase Ste14